MNEKLEIRMLLSSDIQLISDAFSETSLYDKYLKEQERGQRAVLVAFADSQIVGYLTVVWESEYPPFREKNIPEIKDLRVLFQFRRRRIASRLLDRAEEMISARSNLAGIGVGLYSHYGPAQRLYTLRGHIPDGNGLCYENTPVAPGGSVRVDDELTLQLVKPLHK
jgi:ribosomal protein S18 acetylase RimI-like enzyme